ncbi:beta-galactosidase [Allosaccharopolyspora coralli]|uniref:Beta-galactosidase n=1 Tax=Allosaccharopolyspora coralli TaxID=2665642 RepID=A0A5Q3QDC4_9PSEU|nr:glycoside hydrolase family 2 TIM barrel-domain containing protein [Allosaccharopolyspora coralli]QGK69559.1 beta-galactosidase [Allosaccharopolyspora coralli]
MSASDVARVVGRARRTLKEWSFGPLPSGQEPASVPDESLSTVVPPHTVVPLSWRRWDPASWERRWLYRHRFRVDPASTHRWFLLFDGTLTAATVHLDGHLLEPHLGGYLPWCREITSILDEAPGPHVLDVELDGAFLPEVPPNHGLDRPSSAVDFWQPAGLYRQVHLVAVPEHHLADVHPVARDVLGHRRRLEVRCEVESAGDGVTVGVAVRDDDRVLAEASAACDEDIVTVVVRDLDDIALWSTRSPKLYTVDVELRRDGHVLDRRSRRIGFRDAEFRRDGFYLNGERLQLFGLNRHQLYPFAGGAMPARVQRRDAEILRRELNCTMVRCSHYPQHEAFLDACDELGLLVWDEPPSWQYLGDDEWLRRAYRDVGDMVVRARHHPSVIVWAARLNETADHPEFYAATQDLVQSLDDSRQTTGAVLGTDHATERFQHDVFGYNDYSASRDTDGRTRPELAPPRDDRPYLVSEAVGTLSGPAMFYRRTDPQDVQQGQAFAHARVHDLGLSDPRYTGVLPWAGFDYPSGHGNVADGIKWPGVLDLFRIPKPGAAVYRAQVSPEERVVIEPSFSWDFDPTSPATALRRAAIWSNLDRLELAVDGSPFATLWPARDEFPRLPYPPFLTDLSTIDGSDAPRLRIDGYLGDTLVLTRHLSSDRGRDRLSLVVDDPALVADGADATRAELRAVDEHGTLRPYVTGDVTLDLDGPAELVGDNPFPLEATGGAGAVWIRSRLRQSGIVTLTGQHPTLGTATASLSVDPSA